MTLDRSQRERQMVVDMTGARIARLTVMRRAGSNATGQALWLCRCECGAETTVLGVNLRKGMTRSCGCLHREVTGARATTHGATRNRKGTPEYYTWSHMRRRCFNPSDRNYPNYGGRGITVCGRWLDFACFLADMGPRPAGTTIDRINNDGNYEPGNCRWATPHEQNSNRRSPALAKRAYGEKNSHAALTAEQVREMRDLRARGLFLLDLAARFGVSRSTVSRVCRGDSYRHTPLAGLSTP